MDFFTLLWDKEKYLKILASTATGKMNRIILALTICCTLFFTGTVSVANIKQGLSEYKWGENITKYPALKKAGEKGEVTYYSKPGEVYTIGSISVANVVYGFYEDKLFGIYLNIDSADIYDQLFSHMKKEYGLPDYKNTAENQPIYKWKEWDVTVKLKLNQIAQKMKLAFYYMPIANQANTKQADEYDDGEFFNLTTPEKDQAPEKIVLFEF